MSTGVAPPLRLLVLSPFVPRSDAVHGGARAVATLVAALAARHELGLLCVRERGEPPTVDPDLERRCAFVETFVSPLDAALASAIGRSTVKPRVAAGTLAGRPKWVTHCAVPVLAARVRHLMGSWRPDLVHAELHVMGQYAPAVAGAAPFVLRQLEPGGLAARDRWRDSRGLDRMVRWVEAMAWRRYEARIAPEVDAFVALTERDARHVRAAAPLARVVTIPLTVPLGAALDPAGTEPDTVLFHASYAHPPNLDAAERLVRSILPGVRSALPGTRLLLVGGGLPPALAASPPPGVAVTGRVASVEPFLDRAAVVVAPLRRGGGMRVKVLETLAAGKALVASSLAVDGLELREGEHYLRADSDEEVVAGLLALLRDPARRAELGASARRWAEAAHAGDRSQEAYDSLYAGLLAERRARPPAAPASKAR